MADTQNSQTWVIPVASREEIAAGYVVPVDPASDFDSDCCQ